MEYKFLIEDMDGGPLSGVIRWGTGNSFIKTFIDVPAAGKSFPAGEVESYEFVEVRADGYYDIIVPTSGLWATTHFRLHQKPNWVMLGFAGVLIGAGFYHFVLKK